MTDEVLSKLKKWCDADDWPDVTATFQELSTMHHYGMTPGQWRCLKRVDRKVLSYHRLMGNYYEVKAMKDSERKSEQQTNQQKFMASLPAQARIKR